MFHVRRRPSDAQPRRRKKKTGAGTGSARPGNEPMLVEVTPEGTVLENGRRVRITDVIEVGVNFLLIKYIEGRSDFNYVTTSLSNLPSKTRPGSTTLSNV